MDRPAQREFTAWVTACLEKQAIKHAGFVDLSGRTAVLLTPYKDICIEVSKELLPGHEENEYTYARFRSPFFADKSFKVIVNSDDVWLKPRFVAHRIEVSDDRFKGKYVVDASDAGFVKSVLSPEIRERLLQQEFNVRFGKRVGSVIGEEGWLTIFTIAIKEESYDNMIDVAAMFYERFLAVDASRRIV